MTEAMIVSCLNKLAKFREVINSYDQEFAALIEQAFSNSPDLKIRRATIMGALEELSVASKASNSFYLKQFLRGVQQLSGQSYRLFLLRVE